jgi:hypothetical protein
LLSVIICAGRIIQVWKIPSPDIMWIHKFLFQQYNMC